MGFFNKNKTEKEIEELKTLLKNSFENVKNDTSSIFEWLNYFNQKIYQQQVLINELKAQLHYMPKTRKELRDLIDTYYSINPVLHKIEEIKAKIDAMEAERNTVRQHIYHHDTRLQTLEKPKQNFKEKLLKKISKSSKEYVKNIILNLIEKYERISALQLRDIIVEEQILCSKSSFYRILEEIEKEEEIGVIHDKKEKKYICKAIKLR